MDHLDILDPSDRVALNLMVERTYRSRIDALAAHVRVSRSEMCRRLLALGAVEAERQLATRP